MCVYARAASFAEVASAAVRLIRWTHSCIRLERDGCVVVIDPGVWSEPQALLGADAVLLTHDHFDHADVLRLRGCGVAVFAPRGSNLPGLDFTAITAGQDFLAAGFQVSAVGGVHAPVLPGQPLGANLGYLVDGLIYHPGDALHLPGAAVDTLLVPLQASWLKTAEAVAFTRAVAPSLAIGIHDAQVNDRALQGVNYWLAEHSATTYRWLAPGSIA